MVNSRAITHGLSPKVFKISLRVLCNLLGFSKKITVPLNKLKSLRIATLPFFGGKKPSNINLSVGKPEVVSAQINEEGPGMLSTVTVSYTHLTLPTKRIV